MKYGSRGEGTLKRLPRRGAAVRPRNPAVTSRIMAAVRSRDTGCELALRRELWRRGLRYRLYARKAGGDVLPGKPDLVFSRERVVVFVDGDFWHGRLLQCGQAETFASSFRAQNRGWWMKKIGGNVARDTRVTRQLRAKGWLVIRVWESELLSRLNGVADRIERSIVRRRN